jgi:hypothetical protein
MDNFVSFNRFTNLPLDISQHGLTVEEFKRVQGSPDADPFLSPMPKPGVSNTQLALTKRGSDNLRLHTPQSPPVNPHEGPKLTLVLSRNGLNKLKGPVLTQLLTTVDDVIDNDELRGRMRDSLARVQGLVSFVDQLNQWTEVVYAHRLGTSQG